MNDWKLFAFGSAFFAGLTAILAKIGVKNISSPVATLIRTFVILLLVSSVVLFKREFFKWEQIETRSLVFLGLSGITTGISWLCYYRALQNGPASLVAPIDKLSLIVAIILAVIFLKESLSVPQWTGVLLMTGGAFLIAFK